MKTVIYLIADVQVQFAFLFLNVHAPNLCYSLQSTSLSSRTNTKTKTKQNRQKPRVQLCREIETIRRRPSLSLSLTFPLPLRGRERPCKSILSANRAGSPSLPLHSQEGPNHARTFLSIKQPHLDFQIWKEWFRSKLSRSEQVSDLVFEAQKTKKINLEFGDLTGKKYLLTLRTLPVEADLNFRSNHELLSIMSSNMKQRHKEDMPKVMQFIISVPKFKPMSSNSLASALCCTLYLTVTMWRSSP
jgi:hypothetical protein